MPRVQAVVFCTALVYAAVYDIRTRLVDDRVCIIIALAGLITFSPASLLGAALCALPFYIGSGLGKNGAGDIYIAGAAGFVLGASRTLAGLTLFAVLYSVYVLVITLTAKLGRRQCPQSCPLVPFIAAGFIPAYFLAGVLQNLPRVVKT